LSAGRDPGRSRTIVIRQGSGWPALAFLCLSLLLFVVVMLGHQALDGVDRQSHETHAAMAQMERKIQQPESGLGLDSRRRRLLVLGMGDPTLRVHPKVSLGEAYRYATLAVDACERYPAVDPLLLLAIGTVESRYDVQATSAADARGLYQIWPSTGRLLLRNL